MRDAIAVVLGLPAAMAGRLAPSPRRRPALRMAGLAAAVALLTLAALNTTTTPITAFKAAPVDPHGAARLAATLETDTSVDEPVVIDFSAPMDPASVQAATTVQPSAEVVVSWSNGGRTLRLAPSTTWQTGTIYTVTVGNTATDLAGTALATPIRAVFLTRDRPSASLVTTRPAGKGAHPGTGIAIRLSAPVEEGAVARAFSVEPPVLGSLEPVAEPGNHGADAFVWTPDEPLEPGVSYTFRLASSMTDVDGVSVEPPAPLTIRVAGRPEVVRSQPAAKETKVDRDQTISVRFTTPMDRRVTRSALRVSGLKPSTEGRISWAEGGRVLIFDPRGVFAHGQKVTIAITGAARSAAGVTVSDDPEAIAYSATFTVAPKPPVRPAAKPRTTVTKTPTGGSGSTSAPWLGVEKYYLKLLNCTRTGGWVLADGSCKGYGSGTYSAYVKPLSLSVGISNKVARPYARKLAVGNDCSHFMGGDPGDRLRRAGYTSYRWAENLGCRSGNPYDAVLGSHRYFQSEKAENGGHWRHIKDPRFSVVGIGVWKSGGAVRLVTDFYHP